MSAPLDRPSDSSSERQTPETSTRRCASRARSTSSSSFWGGSSSESRFSSTPCGFTPTTWPPRVSTAVPCRSIAGWSGSSPKTRIAWYNLACSFAVLGMIEPAFSALQKALELGYRTASRLRRDPDLKSLRRDPRFARLLRRFGFVVI